MSSHRRSCVGGRQEPRDAGGLKRAPHPPQGSIVVARASRVVVRRRPLSGRVLTMASRERHRQVESQRLFVCERCRRYVVVCARCDRGQRYCGRVCSQDARRENQRASNARYQATARGRRLHTARQARYRERRRQRLSSGSVTEQGRRRPPSASLRPWRRPSSRRCPACGAPQTPFLRLEPNSRPIRGLRPSRPAGRRL
jgi:hypothetical protein